jgi:hypothetical protein
LPRGQVQARIDAALAASGRIVNNAYAPSWWTLADPEGSEFDLTIWGWATARPTMEGTELDLRAGQL